jgi:hypothetical protein
MMSRLHLLWPETNVSSHLESGLLFPSLGKSNEFKTRSLSLSVFIDSNVPRKTRFHHNPVLNGTPSGMYEYVNDCSKRRWRYTDAVAK